MHMSTAFEQPTVSSNPSLFPQGSNTSLAVFEELRQKKKK